MVELGLFSLISGIILFIMYKFMDTTNENKNTSLRNGAIILAIGGLVGGCMATPSRDMPNGMPGASIFCIICVILGVILVITSFVFKNTKRKFNSSIPLIIICAIFVIFLIVAFASSTSSPRQLEPWEKLGVSKQEYTEVYNYYK